MKPIVKELLSWVKSIAITLIVFLVINIFITTTTVYNISMYPTLQEKNFLVLSKMGEPQIGDIVSFKSNLELSHDNYEGLNILQKLFHHEGEPINLIKRVIASSGDFIEVRDGLVFVNDTLLEESYVSSYITGTVSRIQIPEGKLFVMGDNRSHSQDSRDFGVIDSEDVIGKVFIRILPLNQFGNVN